MPIHPPRRLFTAKICAACMSSGAVRFRPASRQRWTTKRVRALTLTLGISALLLGRTMANSPLNVKSNGSTNLSISAAYTTGTAPTTTSDVTFTSGTTYSSPTSFTFGSTTSLGTLNDLDTQTISIGGSNNITLYGGSNSVAANPADLLYVATGASLSLTSNQVNIDSGVSAGNLDIAGTYSQSFGLRGGSASLVLTKTGAGSMTLVSSTGNDITASNLVISGGSLILTGAGSQAGVLSGTSQITVNSAGTLNIAGTSADTLGYTTGKEVLTINGGTVTNTGGAKVTLQNTLTMVGGTLTGTSTVTNGAFEFNATNAGNGLALTATSDASGTAALISAPNVSLASSETFNVTRGSATPAVDVNISSAVINFSTSTGNLTKTGNGILQLSGNNTFSGAVAVNAGTLILSGTNAYTGTTTVSGSTLQLTGSVTSGNALTLGGSTFNYAPTTGGSTQTLGTLALSFGANTVSASSGNTLALGAISRTAGVLNFNPSTSGTITTSTGNSNGSTTNGIIGTYASYGSGTSLSYATATGASAPYTVAAYTGGTAITAGATGVTGSASTNYSAAGGFTGAATGQTFNTVRYTGSGDTITIPSGSKITLGGLMNAGTGTLTINGPVNSNQSQGVGAGNFSGNPPFSNFVVLGNTQGIIFNAGIVNAFNATTSSYNTSSVNFATQGTVTLNNLNYYTGSTSVLSGTLKANATNALATTSSVSVSAGAMLSLAATNALATPAAPTTTSTTAGTPGTATGQVPITLGGGTLLRNGAGISLGSGTTVGAGALTLNAASTLDFGTTGAGTLNFNAFDPTSGFTLTVLDYNNVTNAARTDGTDDRLIFNEPLTTSMLSDISFNGTAATEILLGNGEYEILPITAVPEPSTWVGGLLAIGMVGGSYLRRRRRCSVA